MRYAIRVIGTALVALVLGSDCASEAAGPSTLSIAPREADVWAWEVDVGGASVDGTALAACDVNGERAFVDGARWSSRVHLDAGPNEIVAECRDERGRIVRSPPARFIARLRDVPKARIEVDARKDDLVLDGTSSLPSERSRAPIVAWSWELDGITREGGSRLPVGRLRDGIHTARLTVRDARGQVDRGAKLVEIDGGQARPLEHAASGKAPWVDDAIVYGIVPPLFGDPPLASVTRALSDLADLGITALWLSPIFATSPDDYGYAVTDPFAVRPEYGTEADLRELIGRAHGLGLRVLLDFVPNHAPREHAYVRDVEATGDASHYKGFFVRDARGEVTHYFDWENLYNLRYEEPEVARWTNEAAARWLRDFHVDGFRLDAAWGIRERTPAFWDVFEAEVRRIVPDAILLAEAPAHDSFWLAHGFDAAYDWSSELGHAAWETAFDDPGAIAERLDAAIAPLAGTDAAARALRFLDNNDTGARFLTRHGPQMTRVAAALLFTVPGVPCLFTGDERGAEFEPYGNRTPLSAEDPHGLREWYKRLIATRRSVPSLRGRDHARLGVEPNVHERHVYAYARGTGENAAIVVLNFSGERADVRVTMPAGTTAATWQDALSNRALRSDTREPGSLALGLDPWDAVVLVPLR